MPPNLRHVPAQVADLIAKGKLVDALVLLRDTKEAVSREAAGAVERLRTQGELKLDRRNAPRDAPLDADSAAPRAGASAPPLHRRASLPGSRQGLAPGEVPRTSEWPVAAALILLVIVGWLAFR